jgi:hypothetical protein
MEIEEILCKVLLGIFFIYTFSFSLILTPFFKIEIKNKTINQNYEREIGGCTFSFILNVSDFYGEIV